MDLHTLTKVRTANKHSDGAQGIVYVHQWPQGFKEVVFESETLADKFLEMLNKKPDVSATDAPAVSEAANAQPA